MNMWKKLLKKDETPPTIQKVISQLLTTTKGITLNHTWNDIIGTSGQGDLHGVDYNTLKKLFGKPNIESGSEKTRKHWAIGIDGVICTIYDWKQGKSYRGYRPLKYTRWSVGGSHEISLRLVQGVIDSHRLMEMSK
tara:strand:- start:244 stop:651 length:408 start_codon:yes stop_codon:yes gene_type:complete